MFPHPGIMYHIKTGQRSTGIIGPWLTRGKMCITYQGPVIVAGHSLMWIIWPNCMGFLWVNMHTNRRKGDMKSGSGTIAYWSLGELLLDHWGVYVFFPPPDNEWWSTMDCALVDFDYCPRWFCYYILSLFIICLFKHHWFFFLVGCCQPWLNGAISWESEFVAQWIWMWDPCWTLP